MIFLHLRLGYRSAQAEAWSKNQKSLVSPLALALTSRPAQQSAAPVARLPRVEGYGPETGVCEGRGVWQPPWGVVGGDH